MSNQIVITSGAKVRSLEGVITGSAGVLGSVPLGAANGVATLDSGGKVPVSQLPSSVVTYLGTWNAATNTPTLTNGVGDAGDMYICNVAGTVNFGAGPVTFAVGDWVLYGSGTWQKSNGQNGTVTSVGASITGNAIGLTGSPITTAGTLAFAFAGTSGQYVNGAGNLTTFPTLITSIGLSMPSAFSVANSPLTANGSINVTGAGTSSQYIDGTGALQTFPALTGYVPYTGATADVDLGTHVLNAQALHVKGTAGAGHLGLKHQTASPTGSANESLIFADVNGNLGWQNDNLYLTTLVSNANTANRSYTFPNASGTLALTSDISYPVTSVFGRTGAVTAQSGDYTTTLVTEGTRLYYTDARSRAALSFTAGSGAYNSTTGVITIPTNTSQLTNGANFITLASLSAGAGISYNNTTGVITSTITQYTDAMARAAISGGTGISYNSTTGVITNTITQYTDALARAAISLTTTGTSGAATYNSTTGVLNIPQYTDAYTGTVTSVGLSAPTGFSVSGTPVTSSGTLALAFAAGYSLPTTASQTNWDTAYTNRITSATSPLSITSNVISISQATTSTSGYLSSTDWNTFNNKQGTITLTTTGSSGAATLVGTTLNIPNYGSALSGYLPLTGGILTGNTFITNGSTFRTRLRADAARIDFVNYAESAYVGGFIEALTLNLNTLTNNPIATGTGTVTLGGGLNGTSATFSSSVTALSITGTNSVNTSGGMTIANDLTWTNNVGYGLKGQDGTRFLAFTTSSTQLDTSSVITFLTNGSEKMRLTNSGNVGIGTTSPNAILDVYTSQGGSTIAATHGTGGSYPKASGISFGATSTSLTVSNNGGTTTFTGGAGIYATNSAASNNPTDLVFWTTYAGSPTERMRITSGGNVLIGTTTDSGYKLDVNGTGRFAASYTASGTVAIATWQRIGGSVSADMTYNDANTSMNFGTSTSHTLNIKTNNTTALSLASSGAATFSSSVTAANITSTTAAQTTLTIASTETSGRSWTLNTAGTTYGSGAGSFVLRNNGVDALVFNSSSAATFSSSVTANGALTANATSTFSNSSNLSAIFSNAGAVSNFNSIELRGGTAGTAVNWQISKDNTVSNAFQITPSTTSGGATYTTPIFTLTSAGAATFSSRLMVNGATDDGSNALQVNGSIVATSTIAAVVPSNVDMFVFNNTGATYTKSCVVASMTATGGTGSYFFYGQQSTSTVALKIFSNGNIQNTNNSYGAISDARLKENITDATPKLDDLLKVKVRNYNLKGEKTKQLGVISQELEEIFPNMIEESTNLGENVKIKGVKYSVFVPMLIKAVQELKAEIETLKNK